MNRKLRRIILLFVVLKITIISDKPANAQMNGGLFLLPDNFYTQMINPAFMRPDNGHIIAVPGLAGFSFRNTGNYKFSDFVYSHSSGEMVLDFNRILLNGNTRNKGSEYIEIPVFYVGIPVKNGMFSVYYRERIQSSFQFSGKALSWFEQGNFPDMYRNYNTGDIDFRFLGTHELAAGITKIVNKKIKAGIRGKLVFGAAYINAKNWNYGINTSETGDQLLLTSGGSARMALKFPVETSAEGKITRIVFEKPMKNYILNFSSPGVALDAGILVELDKLNQISLAINDFGFIGFLQNSKKIYQDGSYLFKGFNVTDVIENRDDDEKISPLELMLSTKDSIRNVYRPVYTNSLLFTGISPKVNFQYSHKYNQFFTAGIGNQTIFQKGYWINTFSINALFTNGGLSTIANLSLYNMHSLTFGGGIQWTNKSSQLFLFTDNILAMYHPAAQKSFSLTVGMNILLEHDYPTLKTKMTGRKGVISPNRPFYKKYN